MTSSAPPSGARPCTADVQSKLPALMPPCCACRYTQEIQLLRANMAAKEAELRAGRRTMEQRAARDQRIAAHRAENAARHSTGGMEEEVAEEFIDTKALAKEVERMQARPLARSLYVSPCKRLTRPGTQEVLKKLPEDKREQEARVRSVDAAFKRTRDVLMLPAESCKAAEQLAAFLQHCILPRVLLGPIDAAYCAHFLLKLTHLRTPRFYIIFILSKVRYLAGFVRNPHMS